MVFGDTPFGGRFRNVEVAVGMHQPPNHEMMPKYMDELEARYRGKLTSEENIFNWYFDFETVHPFEDGNGRVGGIILATYSHQLTELGGYWAPGQ